MKDNVRKVKTEGQSELYNVKVWTITRDSCVMPFQGENAAAKDGPEGFNSDSEIPSEDIR